MSMAEQIVGTEGERVFLFGPWKDPKNPEKLTPEGEALAKWLAGEDIPIDPNIIREEFRRQERFRNDIRFGVSECARIISEKCAGVRHDYGRPVGPEDGFEHGVAVGKYVAYRTAQQLFMDCLNAATLGICK